MIILENVVLLQWISVFMLKNELFEKVQKITRKKLVAKHWPNKKLKFKHI